jgi:hypothetical protein
MVLLAYLCCVLTHWLICVLVCVLTFFSYPLAYLGAYFVCLPTGLFVSLLCVLTLVLVALRNIKKH